MPLTTGSLVAVPVTSRPDLVAAPVAAALRALGGGDDIGVVEIDPDVSDTAVFTATYGVGAEVSANCVVVAGKRDGVERIAACMILATTRADVNGVVRKRLDVRKASFLPMDRAVGETGMEYGGITPIGLPGWPVLVDARIAGLPVAVIGSGLRRSKLLLPGAVLATLPGAVVVDGLARPIG
jgi:prolyl-tRNA editing enzyme YbaK/EbsC (Cys-tRNA(Pro) deacylase)